MESSKRYLRKVTLGLVALATWLTAGTWSVAEEAIEASQSEITQWVSQLDSNQFEIREHAQSRLAAAGKSALRSVAETARSGSLEGSTRAINVLLSWSEGADRGLAVAALEQLSKLKNHPKEAQLAGELLADVREKLALESIEALGGSYQNELPYGTLNIHLPYQSNLQVIIGKHWKGGEEGLRHLEKVPHAAIISFHSPPLGDKALEYLTRLPQLRRIELYGTKMSKEAIEALTKKLVNIPIDVRGGAFLGVKGGGPQAQVMQVVPGSAADIAGIKEQDVITDFDGQQVKDFVSLTGLIAGHQPGDVVSLKLLRPQPNAAPLALELSVTFAQWGEKTPPPEAAQAANPQLQVPRPIPPRLNLERR